MARARKASGAKDDKTGKAKKSQSRKKKAATRATPASKSSSSSSRASSGNKDTKRGVKSGTPRPKKSPPKKAAKKKAVTKSTSKATTAASGASSSSGGSGNKKQSTSSRASSKKTSSSTKSGSKTTKSKATKSAFPAKFLKEMHELLETERETYERQAAQLRAEAQSLVEDLDPGDVQFDEESGEGDTIAVERNRDLALASKAQEMIGEIDHALGKFDDGTYGICEISGEPIPKERLEAIPWAREKVEYKVGGFGRR